MAEGTTRVRKLEKEINWDEGKVTFKVVSTGDVLECSVTQLPKEIAAKMVPLAISHRIGDAAAGKDGAEAFESMSKVWEALTKGDFTVRAPAGSKLPSKAKINEALEGMDETQAAAAKAVLEKLGISL